MPRALKVFQTEIGFYELIVAAPSQAAALRAWGLHLNLFADGTARMATDERVIEAALAQPGVCLKRGVGSRDAFSLNPGLPRLPELGPVDKNKSGKLPSTVSKSKHKPPPKTQPKPKPRPEPPDRRALDAAEADLRRIDAERRIENEVFEQRLAGMASEEEDLRRRRAAIEAEATAAKRRHEAVRSQAEKLLRREERGHADAAKR